MPDREPDAWDLVLRPGPIDALTFLKALARTPADDFRSKLLRRDGLAALRNYWGSRRVEKIAGRLNLQVCEVSFEDDGGGRGFSTLLGNIMDATTPDTILRMLRELGQELREPARIVLGGSSALILEEMLQRRTDDIDLVDEIPSALRKNHALVEDLVRRYKLRVTHFQSHYLPEGWQMRTHSVGIFYELDVRAIDTLDVLAGKLFSRRKKDLDDIGLVLPFVGLPALRDRVARCCENFKRDEKSRTAGENNWYILTGEKSLPSVTS